MHSAVAALTLAAVLEHAGAYVTAFEQRLAGIVAEEQYVQTTEPARPALPARTELRSDLLLVRPIGAKDWVQFMSELAADNRTMRAVIDASYQSEPLLDMLVPIEMRESYQARPSRSRTEAVATYGRFRQFSVTVTEQFLIRK
jgi:hypothetical protein